MIYTDNLSSDSNYKISKYKIINLKGMKIMLKKRHFISMLSVFGIIASNISMASASPSYNTDTNGYVPFFDAIGIPSEAYMSLPDETKAFYTDLEILDSDTVTKYFKVISEKDNENVLSEPDNINVETEDILVEISQDEYELAESLVTASPNALVNPDEVGNSNTWYKIETSVLEVSTSTPGIEGDYGQYVLSMDVEIIGEKILTPFEDTYKGYIAGGINENCSPISGSEFMTETLVPVLGGPDQHTTYTDAPYGGGGCGFDFSIGVMAEKSIMHMAFMFEPNQPVSIIDGYGFCGYWTKKPSVSISISLSGPSISVSPMSQLVKAPDTHAQLRP